MLGLCLALRLSQLGHRVTLIEAGPEIGGLTRCFHDSETSWDRFYHVIDASDAALLGLLGEIGLGDEVQWRTTKTLLFDGTDHHPLNDIFDYLRLPTLGWIEKFRIGLNIAYAGTRTKRGGLESISAEQWLSRWSGSAAYKTLWAPLLKSKLGANYDRVSAAYIWSVIRRFYGAREGRQRTEKFGFVPGGYARVIHRMTQRLTDLGVTIETNRPVRSCRAGNDGSIEVSDATSTRSFRRVIATVPGPQACRIIGQADSVTAALHEAIPYQGVVCLSLLVDRPFGGAYMTYITDDTVPFTTIIEMSALTGCEIFGHRHLVYLPRYVPADDALFERDDAEISGEFLAGLTRLYPDFSESQVVTSRLAKARHVMAVPTPGYSKRLPPVRTALPGLTVCNSAHIVDASLSVTEAVALANKYAPMLADDSF